jgi:hypothetical protein
MPIYAPFARTTPGGHTEVMATEFRADELDTCFIKITYRGDTALLLLLSRDGTINRMGDGAPPIADGSTLYIGKVTEPLFERLMEVIPAQLWQFRHVGRLDLDDRVGEDCVLTVMFGQSDTESGFLFEILFGSESGGVPRELQLILSRAVELTDPWWQEMRSIQEGGKRTPSKQRLAASRGRRWWRRS